MASRRAPRLMRLPSAALVREVLAHWAHERATIRQGFVALGICLPVTVVAGVVLGAMEALLAATPGLLILVPSAIGLRGAIFGALGARLGTGMLTGLYESGTPHQPDPRPPGPLRGRLTRRGSFVGQNVEAALLLSLVTAAASAVLARLLAGAFGLPSVGVLTLTAIAVVGAVLSSGVILLVVLALARTAQSRSWDMDAIGTPIISATADVTTLPALVLATLLARVEVLGPVMGVLGLVAAVAALVIAVRSQAVFARRIVRESLPVLGFAAVVGILAGAVLSARLDALVESPGLLVVVPPFISICGALGGVLSARLASGLHLGLWSPRALPERPAGLEGSLLVLFAVVGFVLVGVLATLTTGFGPPGPVALVGVTLVAGALATGVMFLVAYYAATASYRFGLDPDNYGIPIVTATMDLSGILCLVAAIALLGVGA